MRSREREVIATRAPSAASARAIPCPMPLLAPVTSAVLFSSPRSTVGTLIFHSGMGLLKGIRRLAPLAAAGLAAGWFLKQQRRLGAGGGPEPSLPPEPTPTPPPAPEPAVSPDEPDEHDDEPLEAHAQAVEAVSD